MQKCHFAGAKDRVASKITAQFEDPLPHPVRGVDHVQRRTTRHVWHTNEKKKASYIGRLPIRLPGAIVDIWGAVILEEPYGPIGFSMRQQNAPVAHLAVR